MKCYSNIYACIRVGAIGTLIALTMVSEVFASSPERMTMIYSRNAQGEEFLLLQVTIEGQEVNLDIDDIDTMRFQLLSLAEEASKRTDYVADFHFRGGDEIYMEIQDRDRKNKEAFERVAEGKGRRGDENRAKEHAKRSNPVSPDNEIVGRKGKR